MLFDKSDNGICSLVVSRSLFRVIIHQLVQAPSFSNEHFHCRLLITDWGLN
jgi:hypothetical protein